jgi:protein-tyrosine phosphatase
MSFSPATFIDIHTHVLPGMDDGPKNLEESAALIRCYTDMGIRQVIASPHYIQGTAWAPSSLSVLDQVAVLQSFLQSQNIAMTIFPGMEIACHKKMGEHLLLNKFLPLGTSSWYLLEPSFTDGADAFFSCLEPLLEQGYSIILAHPERIPALWLAGDALMSLVGQKLRIQLNIGSLLGKFGKESRKAGMELMAANCVYYLASDSHGALNRRPPVQEEWETLEKELGADLLEKLCCLHPAQLLAE